MPEEINNEDVGGNAGSDESVSDTRVTDTDYEKAAQTGTGIASSGSDKKDGMQDKENMGGPELGRKVKRLEGAIGDISGNMSILMEALQKSSINIDNGAVPETTLLENNVDDDDYVIPTTQEEFEEAISKREEKVSEKLASDQKKYEKDYLEQFGALIKDVPEDDKAGIIDEFQKNHNVKSSDNGIVDVSMNYAKATRVYYSKKSAAPKSPLKGEQSRSPLDSGNFNNGRSSKESTSKTLTDPNAIQFAKANGMSEESIDAALSEKYFPDMVDK